MNYIRIMGITLAIITLIALGLFLGHKTPILRGVKQGVKRLCLSGKSGSTFEVVKRYYDQRCCKALNCIKEDFNIPQKRWNSFLKKLDRIRASDPIFIKESGSGAQPQWDNPNHPIVQKTIQLLREQGLNPEAITIVCQSGEGPACANQSYTSQEGIKAKITLDLKLLGARSLENQEGILRHEIMHIVNYDSIEEGYVLLILSELGTQEDELNYAKAMVDYRHLKELRADQLAGAQGGLDIIEAFKKDLQSTSCHPETETHPASAKRVAQLNVVEHYLKNEKPMAINWT